jgi:hypothetical protein
MLPSDGIGSAGFGGTRLDFNARDDFRGFGGDEEGFLADIDFEFDAEGNIRDISGQKHAEPTEPRPTAAPDSAVSSRVRREHEEGLLGRGALGVSVHSVVGVFTLLTHF